MNKVMRRILIISTVLICNSIILSNSANAENSSLISGSYGDNFIWTISGDTLTFTVENPDTIAYAIPLTDGGTDDAPTPWNSYLTEIHHIVFGDKIYSVEPDVTDEIISGAENGTINIETITCSDDFVWDSFALWMKFRTNGGTLIAPKYSQSDYFAFRNNVDFKANGIADTPYLKLSSDDNAWNYIEDLDLLKVYSTDNDSQWGHASRWYGRYKRILVTESVIVTEEPVQFDVTVVSGGVNYHMLLDSPIVYCYPEYEYIDYLREFDDVNLIVLGEENSPFKGDANLDGIIDISDATAVLQFYAETTVGLDTSFVNDAELNQFAYYLADTSGTIGEEYKIDISDATAILDKYAKKASGLE